MAYVPNVIVADQAVRGYCSDLAKETATEYKYLLDAAHELRASLAPHSRMRAALVSMHLIIAAKLSKAAMGQAVDCYAKFVQQFGEDLVEAERRMRGGSAKKAPGALGSKKGGAMNFGAGTGAAKKPAGMTFGGGR
jgi:hypothetical protein